MAVIKEPRLCVKILSGRGGARGQSRLGSSRCHVTLSFTAQGGQAILTTHHNADRKGHGHAPQTCTRAKRLKVIYCSGPSNRDDEVLRVGQGVFNRIRPSCGIKTLLQRWDSAAETRCSVLLCVKHQTEPALLFSACGCVLRRCCRYLLRK